MNVTKIPIHKDNFVAGRNGYRPEAIVIHIMEGSLTGTDQWFGGDNIKYGIYSSAHEGIGKNGDVHVWVEPDDTAYHAGRVNQPVWPGIKKNAFGGIINPNKYTYGIENEGFRGERWTEEQIVSLVERVRLVCARFQIVPSRQTIVSHHEITADKENVSAWCDEIIKRLSAGSPPSVDKEAIKAQIKELVDKL